MPTSDTIADYLGDPSHPIRSLDWSTGVPFVSAVSWIDTAGDHDWFAIFLTADATFTIELSGSSLGGEYVPLDDTYLTLYNSSGAYLAENDDIAFPSNRNSALTFHASASGIYYIQASGFGSHIGAYQLQVHAQDDFGVTGQSGPPPPGNITAPGTITGNIETFGDYDFFDVTLTAGVTYVIDAHGIQLQDTVLELGGGPSSLFISNDNVSLSNLDSEIIFTPTQTGSYYIDVHAHNNAYVGTYSISIEEVGSNVSIVASQSNQNEGNSGSSPSTPFTFTVSLSKAVTTSQTVAWSVSPSSQANAADFVGGVLPSGTMTFNPGGGTNQLITVNVNGDTTVESNESFTIALSNPSAGLVLLPSAASANGTIINDDLTMVSIAAAGAGKAEGNTGSSPSTPFTFTLSVDQIPTTVQTVNWAVSPTSQANAADFVGAVLPSGQVTFNPGGSTSQLITVNVNGDTTTEPDETFSVILSNPSAGLVLSPTSATAIGTIINDDSATISIVATGASKAEGNAGSSPSTPYTFKLSLDQAMNTAQTVNWAVSPNSQANAADFVGGVLPSGSVTFNPGVTSQDITVNVNGDTTAEPDEGFTIALSNPSAGLRLSSSSATAGGTIINDDPSRVSIVASGGSQLEGNSGSTSFKFAVSLDQAPTTTQTVKWTISSSSQANAADFVGGVLPSGTVTFNAGVTRQDISVNINGDTAIEPNENFAVTLSNPSAGVAFSSSTSATGTIQNDDDVITFSEMVVGTPSPQYKSPLIPDNVVTFTGFIVTEPYYVGGPVNQALIGSQLQSQSDVVQPTTIKFETPVVDLQFDAGSFQVSGAALIELYDMNGNRLARETSTVFVTNPTGNNLGVQTFHYNQFSVANGAKLVSAPISKVVISPNGTSDGQFTIDNVRFIDAQVQGPAPAVTFNTDNGASLLHAGNFVTVKLTANSPLTVTGQPTLQLNDNEVAGFTGGSGTNTLTFTYAVQPGAPGDNSSDLRVTGLNLPAGSSIIDGTGNPISASIAQDLGIQVDTTTMPLTSVQQQVFGLYAALYNRATDFGGFSFWVGVVAQQPDGAGVTVANAGGTPVTLNDATVLGQLFVNTQSAYFNTAYGSLSDNDFITALYVNLAGNATNIADGINYWVGLLHAAEAAGQTVQAARAGIVGQVVHDMIDYNVSTIAPGYTAAQWQAVVQRQATIDNKIVVVEALANASQQPGGGILIAHGVGDAAFLAATAVIQRVTYDPATVTAAILGINNAVAQQDLHWITG